MNFLEFVNEKKQLREKENFLTEGFSKTKFKDAWKLITNLIRKNVKGYKVIPMWTPDDLTVDGVQTKSYMIIFNDAEKHTIDMGMSVDFAVKGKSMDPYSVTFYDKEAMFDYYWPDDNGAVTCKAPLNIKMNGASIIYYLPLIYHIVDTMDFNIDAEKAEQLAKKVYSRNSNESVYDFNIGALTYKIVEGRSQEKSLKKFILEHENSIGNSYDRNVMENELQDKKKEVYDKLKQSRVDQDKDLEKKLYKEYRQILDAMNGGATTIAELEAIVNKKVKVVRREEESTQDAIVKFEKQTKDPNQAFKEMATYVKSVIKGLQPGCILCGAPGIGKTYRVLRQLKAAGYVNGQNLDIIKGKCTPRQMYLTMYEHKDKGNILLIDDADSLIGPKAPEDIINILKGALDSTTDDDGGRLVSYRVSGELKDDEGTPVPKRMSYCGSIIVITNYSVGQLDTALRGRVFTQSLDFTTEQLLQVIKEIMPAIEPTKLSAKSKIKAYEYLTEMAEKGDEMEISIRTFGTCARLFELASQDEELTDEDAKSMIKEQMYNMSLRSGKKW